MSGECPIHRPLALVDKATSPIIVATKTCPQVSQMLLRVGTTSKEDHGLDCSVVKCWNLEGTHGACVCSKPEQHQQEMNDFLDRHPPMCAARRKGWIIFCNVLLTRESKLHKVIETSVRSFMHKQ